MPLHVDHVLNLSDLPRECIADCSGPGSADAAVDYWRDRLGFTVDRDRTMRCLAGYGAWEPEELAAEDADTLAARVLWLACGDFNEYLGECERAEVDPDDPPDTFHPSSDSDIFVLE
jgi:hypothetical protein